MKGRALVVILLILGLAMLVGCATTPGMVGFNSLQQGIVVKIATEEAGFEFLRNNPDAIPRVQEAIEIAELVLNDRDVELAAVVNAVLDVVQPDMINDPITRLRVQHRIDDLIGPGGLLTPHMHYTFQIADKDSEGFYILDTPEKVSWYMALKFVEGAHGAIELAQMELHADGSQYRVDAGRVYSNSGSM